MPIILATTKMQPLTGLPEDTYECSLVFDDPAAATPVALATAAAAKIVDFWNTTPAGRTNGTHHYISDAVSRTINSHVTCYDLNRGGVAHTVVTPMGAPIYDLGFLMGVSGSSLDLPSECAICVSFHGDLTGLASDVPGGAPGPGGDTHPAARVRGRIFVGPLNQNVMSSGSPTRVGSTVLDDLVASAMKLHSDMPSWSVWSRKNAHTVPVVGGFVDNAFDTQRRRGEKATGRHTW